MKATITDTPESKPDIQKILITRNLHSLIQQTESTEWEYLFRQLRLNLLSRISGCDDRELIKLQGKIEWSDELEKFFKDVIANKK